MRLAALIALALLLVAPAADARPRKRKAASVVSVRGQTRFLSKDPHGPLAVARGHKLHEPGPGACRTWADDDSVWHSLDRFGRIVGKARVNGMERYDVTGCDELNMQTAEGAAGSGIYASGGYQPAAISPWTPGGKASDELSALVRRRDAGQGGHGMPLDRRMIAWKSPEGDEMAVVGGRQLSVLRRIGSEWRVVYAITPPKREKPGADRFVPVAVLDMDGDGKIEIVVHEQLSDAYGDFTLTVGEKTYLRLDAGIHGAYA